MTTNLPLPSLAVALKAFVAILEEEIEVLSSLDLDRLAITVDAKTKLASAVSDNWNQAMNWLNSLPGTTRTAHGLHVPAHVMPHWLEILNLARQADSLNKRNSILVEAQLQRTQGALDVLQSAARPVNLYGADGQILDVPGLGHSLDKV